MKNNNKFVDTQALIERVKDETQYMKAGLQGIKPFIRADREGNHQLLTILVEKAEKGYIPRKIISLDIVGGEIIDVEDVQAYYSVVASDLDISKPIEIGRKIDRNLAMEYNEQVFSTLDHIRKEIIENGQTTIDRYMEYLTYALYMYSDEFANILLRISRIYYVDDMMEMQCPKCNGSFKANVSEYTEGNIVVKECPFCRQKFQKIYKGTGKIVTFTDKYLRENRKIYDKTALSNKVEEHKTSPVDTFIENEEGFVISERAKNTEFSRLSRENNSRTPSRMSDKDTGVYGNLGDDESDRFVKTYGKPEASNEVVGLDEQEKIFEHIKEIMRNIEKHPPIVLLLKGSFGCGMGLCIQKFTGMESVRYYYVGDAESAARPEYEKPNICHVLICDGKNVVKKMEYFDISRLSPQSMLLVVGEERNIDRFIGRYSSIARNVLCSVTFRSYTPEELLRILTIKMLQYGLQLAELEGITENMRGLNAADMKKISLMIYFEHGYAKKDNNIVTKEEFYKVLKMLPPVKQEGQERIKTGDAE